MAVWGRVVKTSVAKRQRRTAGACAMIGRMKFLQLSLAALVVVGVSAQTETARNGLFAALQRGAAGEVEQLLQHGESAKVVDGDGTPALMVAALFADAKTVEALLKHGADANRADGSGVTALMWAVPDVEKVRVLLAHGANVNAKSATERTPLLVAASYPRTVDLLRLLLERGADLRAQDRTGATALALAVRSADVDVVRFLVERGLDPNGLSPAARRIGFARWDRPTTDYLLSKGLTATPDILVSTANWQPPELVGRWIESGADVNARNAAQYGRTPLLTAATSELAGADTLKLLLDRGADPNVQTTEGESPLDWALYKGDRSKIQVLEQRETRQRAAARGDPSAGARRSCRPADLAPEKRRATSCGRERVSRRRNLHFVSPQRPAGDGSGHRQAKGHRGRPAARQREPR